jgi:hypothetical protein
MTLRGREESTAIDAVGTGQDLDCTGEADAQADNLKGVLWLCRQTLRS